MSDAPDTAERLAELEIRAAHAEQALGELSDVVREQWDVIEALKGRVDRLRDRVAELEQGGGRSRPEDEKPPHY